MKNMFTKKSITWILTILGLFVVSAAFVQIAKANQTNFKWTLYATDPDAPVCEFEDVIDGVLIWDNSTRPHEFTTDEPGNDTTFSTTATNVNVIDIFTENSLQGFKLDAFYFTNDTQLNVEKLETGGIRLRNKAGGKINEEFLSILKGVVIPEDPSFEPDPDFIVEFNWVISCQ